MNALADIEGVITDWATAKGLQWRLEKYLRTDSKVITVGPGAQSPVTLRVYSLGAHLSGIVIKQEFDLDRPYKIKVASGRNDQLSQGLERMFRLAEMWVKEAEHKPGSWRAQM